MSPSACPLCALKPGQLLWSGVGIQVLAVTDSPFPGYTRVIWQDHVAEMTDLSDEQRQHLMAAVYLVEQTQREQLGTAKINLAQFGNQVPHLHWHIIPRWKDDPFFPDTAWSPAPERTAKQQQSWSSHEERLREQLSDYQQALRTALQARFIH
ncbi:HIT family protein [Alcaligenes pakistanensis]|uniref:HIT family protein n=1 Tax=Alcaligenes pakistanensis TaxID=1482717 RepID=A0A8H9IHH3_9BURK|nr:HIT family protein [Alcaligenes pakistanensis]GHC41495.1 HIT family protein [Alcaligenes pakistanensis]HCA18494.1 diadenosine tetraphosphate hydrolase [Alcaligenes faecalis]